ncbi:MAG TPA: hypothetical protein VJ437_02860 [Acidiferrobacterales bacterium]|nr:hypothetical protein [Acidiferrobacterales bacterium]
MSLVESLFGYYDFELAIAATLASARRAAVPGHWQATACVTRLPE